MFFDTVYFPVDRIIKQKLQLGDTKHRDLPQICTLIIFISRPATLIAHWILLVPRLQGLFLIPWLIEKLERNQGWERAEKEESGAFV